MEGTGVMDSAQALIRDNGSHQATGPKQWVLPGHWSETMGPTWPLVRNNGSYESSETHIYRGGLGANVHLYFKN